MSLNFKIASVLGLLFLVITLNIYNNSLGNKLVSSEKEFHKLASELNTIKNVKNYYADKNINKKKLTLITSLYKKNIVSIKEDKESLEFKINNLDKNSVYQLTKGIVNGGFKVMNFKVFRTSSSKAEVQCKVLL